MPMNARFHAWSEDRLHVAGGVLPAGTYRQRSNARNAFATRCAPFRLGDCVEPNLFK